ncbi:YybH family protein [Algoriphagus resistens]|uniref:YybH family protein n=1 Tax=Algoriphagus resistens TaxID=1750590 RepID=UPI001E2D9B55|nr:nuclear transport factor 2 family protein [Algoriphagus resistens]
MMKEIEEFFSAYKNAVWQKNASALLKLYDAEVVQFDMWDRGYYSTLQEWAPEIGNWLGSLGEEKVKVDFEMIKIRQSDSIGFASGLIKFQAISSQGTILRSMKNRITIGFSRFEEGWKVVHQHISAPVASENLTAILDL